MDARQAALNTLIAYRREGAWSEAYLKKTVRAANLDPRDAALAASVCYGVLQNRILLDFYIDSLSSVKKINPRIRDILRIAAYQILFLDRVPDSAAVNEAVKMSRKDNPRAAGFVNALLRKLSAQKDALPMPQGDEVKRLSIMTSHPEWIVKKYLKIFGESARDVLEANNRAPGITVRINSARCTFDKVVESLGEQQVNVAAHEWLPDCAVLSNTGNLEELSAYKEGLITVQDAASQLAALAVGAQPGWHVLDACAAPGGKTFVLAQEMRDSGEVYSCDIHPHKIQLIKNGATRLGLECVHTMLKDAAEYDPLLDKAFDAVLADVPCSGLGIIRKKPDIRYKAPEELKQLPKLQLDILRNVSNYVKPGGVLLYSTCTLLPRENRGVVDAFLSENSEFELAEFELPGNNGSINGDITLIPTVHGTDGFYICKMIRKLNIS